MKKYIVTFVNDSVIEVTADDITFDPDTIAFIVIDGETKRRGAWAMKHSVLFVKEESNASQPAPAPRPSRR